METVFLSLTKSDFQDLIAETVNACLKRTIKDPQQPNPDEIQTVQQAADFLSLTVPTIYDKVHKGELPSMKRGKRLYFLKADLITYLKQGRRKSNAETAAIADEYLTNKKRGASYE